MFPVAYTVRIECDDDAILLELRKWLCQCHIGQVLAAGASAAELHVLDPISCRTLEVRYRFGTREKFGRYIEEEAPKLRQEGLAMFGPEKGVRMSRTCGDIVFDSRS
jgi:hypothetical protein